MHAHPFPVTETQAKEPFEKIHSDLKEFLVESYHRFKYMITFLDDYTSHGWIKFLRWKSDTIKATCTFIAMANNRFKSTIKQWMSDAGGEYKSAEFLDLLGERGIEILQSVPHTPQQNGRAERFNRTLMEKAEAMRDAACLPDSWWEFSLEHAVHVYNHTPMQRLQ
jgi:transposase InsO family protein